MSATLQHRLTHFSAGANAATLARLQRGIEKEGLRVSSNGMIAQTPHPRELGSALTHPHITTDFSEALLEFITPVCHSVDELLGWLTEIHQASFQQLGDELIWAGSMPCALPSENKIPIAQYGSSNIAQMKTVYRRGLSQRYGRAMQTIAGIHYNFSLTDDFWNNYQALLGNTQSLQDFKSEQYFHLIRNFRRYSWLLAYLFGASSAICKTFLNGQTHSLESNDSGTLFATHCTSLRMGDLGYQSNAQNSLFVGYNSLEEYATTLREALDTPHPDYDHIGTHIDGERVQLNTALLQIENEFYSSIRPKRVAQSGEAPLHALLERGVEYIEVRCLDINPYLPLGIDADQIRFLDAFLLFCLFENSEAIDADICKVASHDTKAVIDRGRDPNLALQEISTGLPGATLVTTAAQHLMADIKACAGVLDTAKASTAFSSACAHQAEKLEDPAKLPSAMVLNDLKKYGGSYFNFAMHHTHAHLDWFAKHPLTAERKNYFDAQAAQSLARQTEIEASDSTDFETFLSDYYSR